MAESNIVKPVVLIIAKKKMRDARAGIAPLAVVKGFAFGDGGIAPDGSVKIPSDIQTELNHELYRKVIDGYVEISDTEMKYMCTLSENELAGESISEIALYDSDEDLICIKNFMAKGKDGDLEMTFNIADKFV